MYDFVNKAGGGGIALWILALDEVHGLTRKFTVLPNWQVQQQIAD